jgi:hypothetical protein
LKDIGTLKPPVNSFGISQANAQPLKAGPTSTELEAHLARGSARPNTDRTLPTQRIINTPYTGALLRVNIGLAKHAGDWNSSPTALHHLRAAFIERCGLPEVEVNIDTLDLRDIKRMLRCRMIMVTSNQPIQFKPAEIEAMQKYVRAGGTLWINDSSASDFEGFDVAFRADVPKIVPGGQVSALPMDHTFFNSCYDLRKGYKGFRVPPGDKYRQNFIEGVTVAINENERIVERAGIIYTRNDYADGLEIDPRMQAGMKSLTDLTNAEMQEASLRFGINLIAYSLGAGAPKMPVPPENTAEFEKIYRYSGPALPPLDDFSVIQDQFQKSTWLAESEWCNQTQMNIVEDKEEKTRTMLVNFAGGTKFKAAVTRNVPIDLAGAQAIVFDLESKLGRGINVALLFVMKDGKAYETRPLFVRPGWNRNLRFPLGQGDFKSSASKEPWKEYDTAFEPRAQVERMSILLYNASDIGAAKIGALRLQK